MLRFPSSDRGADTDELLRLWQLPDGTRCVLAASGSAFEIRLVGDGGVLRRIPCGDPRRARDIGHQWRVEYELTRTGSDKPTAECPECGEDGEKVTAVSSPFWLHCPSCGHTWLLTESLR